MQLQTLCSYLYARTAAWGLGILIGWVCLGGASYRQDPAIPVPQLSGEASQDMDRRAPLASEHAERTAIASDFSGGCGVSSPYTGKYWATAIDGNGKPRRYLVQLPADYDHSRAYPLVFVFHGAGMNAAAAYAWGLQNTAAARNNAIFVFPDGIPYRRLGVGWDDSKSGYDMPFFDNMVQAMEAAYCVNTKRIFAAGFSWGGDFVTALICARGGVLRAAAVNSTTDEYRNVNDFTTYDNNPCPSSSHPPIRFEHAVNGDPQYPAPLFKTTSELFRHFNVCSTSSSPVRSSSSSTSCVSYDSCARQVIECSFSASIGHALPPSWAQDTWAFFDSYQ